MNFCLSTPSYPYMCFMIRKEWITINLIVLKKKKKKNLNLITALLLFCLLYDLIAYRNSNYYDNFRKKTSSIDFIIILKFFFDFFPPLLNILHALVYSLWIEICTLLFSLVPNKLSIQSIIIPCA